MLLRIFASCDFSFMILIIMRSSQMNRKFLDIPITERKVVLLFACNCNSVILTIDIMIFRRGSGFWDHHL